MRMTGSAGRASPRAALSRTISGAEIKGGGGSAGARRHPGLTSGFGSRSTGQLPPWGGCCCAVAIQKPEVGLLEPLAQGDLGPPAETIEGGGVQSLPRRTVRLGGIEPQRAPVADYRADQGRQLADARLIPRTDVDQAIVSLGPGIAVAGRPREQNQAGVSQVVYMQ